ncbi:MAG: hypothetical protein ACFFAN_04735 [Promethearchaeota archaeon]
MGFADLKELTKKKNKVFLWIVVWLLVGIFLSAFFPFWGIYALTLLIGLCATMFVLSILGLDLRNMKFFTFILILVISILLAFFLLLWNQVIFYLFFAAIVSYILITAGFGLYGCYAGGKDVDEIIYTKFPSPLNHITRWLEFLGGIFLGLLIIYLTFIFTGGQLFLITWVIIISILVLAGICILFLLTGRFNAWLGTFSIYVGIYFFYLVVSLLYASTIYSQTGAYPIVIRLIIATLDILILLYTIGTLIGERAEIISKKVKVLKPETILMWLIFSKACYELAILLDPNITSLKNQWVLFIFAVLLGIVGLIGIISYKKYRKKKK